jgi:hypothetical protein
MGDEWGVCVVKNVCPYAETCDLGGKKINKKKAYETLQRSIGALMSARWQRWMRKMSMVAEYMERPDACVGRSGGRVPLFA